MSTGFLIMPKRPYEWRVGAHGCYKFDNADLGFDPVTRPLTSLSSFTFAPPIFQHHTQFPGSAAQQRRMERSAGKYERKRICKQLAQQAASNPLTSETSVRLDRCCSVLSPFDSLDMLRQVCVCVCLPEEFQVNGVTCVGLSSRPSLGRSGSET